MALPQNDSYVAPDGQLFAGRLQVRPLGIAPENAMGVPSITRVVTVDPEGPPLAIISPVGIATSLAFGTPTVRDPAVTAPTDIRKELTMDRLLVFNSYLNSSRYERFQKLVVLEGATASIPFRCTNLTTGGGGANVTLLNTEYTLLVDGVAMATAGPHTTQRFRGTFSLSLENISEGWHVFDIVGHATEISVPWVMYVKKGGPLHQPYVPVATSSYDITHRDPPIHEILWVEPGKQAIARPLVMRATPAFSTAVSRASLHLEDVVPRQSHHRFNIDKNGILSTMDRQSYFFSDLVKKYPNLPLLDGPRGVGTLQMPTHIHVDRHGGAYCTDPWRVVRVNPDGSIVTRAGYRHSPINSNWHDGSGSVGGVVDGDQPTLELVGDWSAIPPERHGFHEIWGMAFDLDSVSQATLDTSAPTQINPIEGIPEHPHLTGPRQFIADSQNNRICLLTYPRNSFTAPPVVTEFITGLHDPWEVLWHEGLLYVSERLSHRIAVYNATTGAFVKVLVSGPALSGVGSDREVVRYTDVTTIRSHDVVGPEGMVIQDGWLYYASWAMRQVKRVHLTTGAIEVYIPNVIDDFNANYMKIAMSDGTFGPRGTVFIWTWSVAIFGFPFAYLPDGVTRWSLATNLNGVRRGKGGAWDSLSYGAAGGVGMGRLYCGHAANGLAMLSLATGADPTLNKTLYAQGDKDYEPYRLRYGSGGYGHYGEQPPFGVSDALDYYLTWNGITP